MTTRKRDYCITFTKTKAYSTIIQAEDYEEAQNIALKMAHDQEEYDLENWDFHGYCEGWLLEDIREVN